ncbi:MAG: metallophosphoesterase family protein [Candidatus Omnitrophota bacterium]|jgi:calcineurin-like phosphoesterase family protein
MIFFTADTHFGHAGILKHIPARAAMFSNVDEMDDALIEQCNQTVQSRDELWLLGDFAWKASKYGHYRQRLRVRKLHVVMGNHDSTSLRAHVSSLKEMEYRRFGTQKFHLTHYPMASWRGRESAKSIHLYGHSHGTIETHLDRCFPGRRSMDVGVDNAYQFFGIWRPFSIDEIIEILNSKGSG